MCPVTCGISRIGPAATNLKSTEMRRRLFDRRQPSPIGVRQVKGVPRTEDDYAQCVAAANALLGLSGSGQVAAYNGSLLISNGPVKLAPVGGSVAACSADGGKACPTIRRR